MKRARTALLIASWVMILAACDSTSADDPARARLDLALAEHYAAHPPPARSHSTPRLIIIGIDGASWANLAPLIDAGQLPNLARLRARGRYGVLESTRVPESAIAWTSMRTGTNPGRHGVFNFMSPRPRQPSYWAELARQGLSSLVVAVPKVSAKEKILGVVVEGWTAKIAQPFAQPKALATALRAGGYDPELILHVDLPGWTQRLRARTDLLLALMAREPWEHAFVVYEYGDTAAHQTQLRSPTWEAVHETIDGEIGRIVDVMSPDDALLIVSDHGWREYPTTVDLNLWLEENGFGGWRSWIFSGESIALRLRAARPNPGSRYVEAAALRERLGELRDPRTGRPVVHQVLDLSDAFPGPFSEQKPFHLLVELETGYHAPSMTTMKRVLDDATIRHHSRDGLYLLVAAGVRPGEGPERSILDVAPTVLDFHGIAATANMEGRPIHRFGTPKRTDSPRPAHGQQVAPGASDAPSTEAEAEALREKLRALGYVTDED